MFHSWSNNWLIYLSLNIDSFDDGPPGEDKLPDDMEDMDDDMNIDDDDDDDNGPPDENLPPNDDSMTLPEDDESTLPPPGGKRARLCFWSFLFVF